MAAYEVLRCAIMNSTPDEYSDDGFPAMELLHADLKKVYSGHAEEIPPWDPPALHKDDQRDERSASETLQCAEKRSY